MTQGASGGPRVIYRHLETAGDRNVRYLTRGRAHGVALQVCVMCDDAKGTRTRVAARRSARTTASPGADPCAAAAAAEKEKWPSGRKNLTDARGKWPRSMGRADI